MDLFVPFEEDMRSATGRKRRSAGFLKPSLFVVLAGTSFALPCAALPFVPIPSSEISIRVAELTPKPWDGHISESTVVNGSCIISEVHLNVTDPINGETWPIHTTLYRPNVTNPVPMTLVIPTIDGVTVLEPRVAGQLCGAKIGAMIAMLHDTTQPDLLPSWGHEDLVNRKEILGLRTLLDFAERDPRFDRNKLGMIGLSLGGVITSMMAGLEPDRLRAAVVVVGGGNMSYILAMSDNDQVGTLRKRRMASLGVTDLSVYETMLSQSLRYDPLFFAGRALRERIMMVMSTVDTKVPAIVQRETYEAFQRPEYMLFNWGHIPTLAQLAYLYMDPVIAFMNSRFEGREAVSSPITTPLASTKPGELQLYTTAPPATIH